VDLPRLEKFGWLSTNFCLSSGQIMDRYYTISVLLRSIDGVTMHIELAPIDEKFIKESVKNGIFRSEAEAVRDAVRRAREREEEKQERLLNTLRLGDADLAAGRVAPYTLDLLNKIETEARNHAATGRKPNPDKPLTNRGEGGCSLDV
jgi:putative addiction module CopG family antidote